jgi:CRISPR/Cas system-associated exonuclease Cas4 (RecB family)
MKFKYPELTTTSINNLRFYQISDDVFYPSITSILGRTLPEEKAKALKAWQTALGTKADKITRDAANRGTAVHLLAERFLKGEELKQSGDTFSTEDINSFNSLKIKLKNINEVWGQEVSLFSNLIGVAGRCDLIAMYGDKPAIIDFKTSIRIKDQKRIEDYKLQMCAYSIMHNEMFNTDIDTGIILMTSGGFPQEFRVDLTKYVDSLLSRIDEFYKKL